MNDELSVSSKVVVVCVSRLLQHSLERTNETRNFLLGSRFLTRDPNPESSECKKFYAAVFVRCGNQMGSKLISVLWSEVHHLFVFHFLALSKVGCLCKVTQ